MRALALALYQYELPEPAAAVILTRTLVGERDAMRAILAWLRSALIELTGERLSAHFVPTASTGLEGGGPFPPHVDCWVTTQLLNIFNRGVPGSGISTMIPLERAWEVLEATSIAPEALTRMRAILGDAGYCDTFNEFNGNLYALEHPWASEVTEALEAVAWSCELGPGQGYFVNDRRWMHGRTPLVFPADWDWDRREHRLYRLGFNNERQQRHLSQRNLDWDAVGYQAAGCLAKH
jgi:hypothetical protein